MPRKWCNCWACSSEQGKFHPCLADKKLDWSKVIICYITQEPFNKYSDYKINEKHLYEMRKKNMKNFMAALQESFEYLMINHRIGDIIKLSKYCLKNGIREPKSYPLTTIDTAIKNHDMLDWLEERKLINISRIDFEIADFKMFYWLKHHGYIREYDSTKIHLSIVKALCYNNSTECLELILSENIDLNPFLEKLKTEMSFPTLSLLKKKGYPIEYTPEIIKKLLYRYLGYLVPQGRLNWSPQAPEFYNPSEYKMIDEMKKEIEFKIPAETNHSALDYFIEKGYEPLSRHLPPISLTGNLQHECIIENLFNRKEYDYVQKLDQIGIKIDLVDYIEQNNRSRKKSAYLPVSDEKYHEGFTTQNISHYLKHIINTLINDTNAIHKLEYLRKTLKQRLQNYVFISACRERNILLIAWALKYQLYAKSLRIGYYIAFTRKSIRVLKYLDNRNISFDIVDKTKSNDLTKLIRANILDRASIEMLEWLQNKYPEHLFHPNENNYLLYRSKTHLSWWLKQIPKI